MYKIFVNLKTSEAFNNYSGCIPITAFTANGAKWKIQQTLLDAFVDMHRIKGMDYCEHAHIVKEALNRIEELSPFFLKQISKGVFVQRITTSIAKFTLSDRMEE